MWEITTPINEVWINLGTDDKPDWNRTSLINRVKADLINPEKCSFVYFQDGSKLETHRTANEIINIITEKKED